MCQRAVARRARRADAAVCYTYVMAKDAERAGIVAMIAALLVPS